MIVNQQELPLVTALFNHCARGYAHLHVPAHRQGRAIFEEWQHLTGEEIFGLDLTELPGLDDLHYPRGVIARAQELAAVLFGADQSFFLVNGSTVGLHALLLTLCSPGEEILVPRNAHRAILGGLILSGAKPVFVDPAVIEEFGIAAGVDCRVVSTALAEHPGVKGLLALHPTYYGVTCDLAQLVTILHRLDRPVLADEAHGVHFPFHDQLPPPALACGVDATVQSMHKLGGSLTQSSLLHLKSHRVDARKVAAALRLLQTSSPSYLLLASLDGARRQLSSRGHDLVDRTLTLAREVREELSRLPGLQVLGQEHLGNPGAYRLDPARLVISVGQLGLTGYQAAASLVKDFRVQVEMADYYNLVVVIGIGTTRQDCFMLVHGLRELIYREGLPKQPLAKFPILPLPPVCRLTPREAWLAPTRAVPLEKSAGEICAEWVSVSPPGIPLLYPGEEIRPEAVDYLRWVKGLQLAIQGPSDPRLETMQVVAI